MHVSSTNACLLQQHIICYNLDFVSATKNKFVACDYTSQHIFFAKITNLSLQ